MDPKLLTPVLLTALVVWAIYRRTRRNFGRQAVNTARLHLRAAGLGLAGAVLLLTVWRNAALLRALLGGVACGAVLALIGLRHTRFEASEQGRFYTPHTYLGVLIMAVFLGRLLFRFLTLYTQAHAPAAAGAAVSAAPLTNAQQTPLTLGVAGLLIGYYVLYNLGVLSKSRALTVPT